jgi:hypothetical protein
MSLETYSAEEHARLLAAEDRYGNAFINAYNVTILLSDLVLWPTGPVDLFFRFYSQVKKYHSLSIVSSVRLHRVQAKMDLRYFLELTVHAGYALAHPQTTAYFDLDRHALGDAKTATSQASRPRRIRTTFAARPRPGFIRCSVVGALFTPIWRLVC